MKQTTENCKGCKDKIGVTNECYFVRYVEVFTCPCFICIVKVMCKNRCEDFEDFVARCAEGTNFLNGKLI